MLKGNKTLLKLGIMGASGYTGQELLSILFRHPGVSIEFISSDSAQNSQLKDLYPQFSCYEDYEFRAHKDALEFDLDLVFFTTPNNIAINEAKKFLDKGISVIDFSADFRLSSNLDYKKYYGFEHQDLELLKKACYGLVEYNRKKIQQLKKPFLIANPGCYTTAANLALYPIFKYPENTFFDYNSIIINAASGVSGAGKKLDHKLSFNEANENFKAYNIAGKHRHTPEINMLLSEVAKQEIKVNFTPHLLPMFRGLYTTCYINVKKDFDFDDFYNFYVNFYQKEIFIEILDKGLVPESKWTNKNNMTFIGMDYDQDTNRIIICSCLDNLMKGAAGQAVQNMNIAFGFEESLAIL